MEDAIYAGLGSKIQAAREVEKLSQGELARRVGLSRPSIVNIEAGRQRVAVHRLFDFAAALSTTPEELLPTLPNPADVAEGLQRELEEEA